MATFLMIPGAQTGTNNWLASTGTDFVDIVDEDDDSTYIHETRSSHQINYIMTNPSVAEESIDFDEDVTVTPRVMAHHTGAGTANLKLDITGVGLGYSANQVSVSNDSSFPTYSFTSTTEKTSGTDWDYAGLEACNVQLICTTNLARFQFLRVSYIFLNVAYTAAPTAVPDNATFFGANF